jgi:hypothetical protein
MTARILLISASVLVSCISAQAATLTVGAGQGFTTLSSAVASATAGDTINILAGTYVDQTATINKALTIQSVGGAAIFTQSANSELANLKGFLVIDASATIIGLTFQNASISDANGGNGAGIRYQSGDLVIRNSSFIGNQDGILATPNVFGTGTLTVANSLFSFNGQSSSALAGQEHAIYANYLSVLTVTDSIFEGTQSGHDIKSRAATSIVTGNTLDDGVTGTTSYAADFSNGGNVTFTGNQVTQGANTQNNTMITYGAEGLVYADNQFLVTNNSFSNTASNATGVANRAGSVLADVSCNSFTNVPTPTTGPATLSNNQVNGVGAACGSVQVSEPPSFAVLLASGLGVLGLTRFRRRAR